MALYGTMGIIRRLQESREIDVLEDQRERQSSGGAMENERTELAQERLVCRWNRIAQGPP